ncbi:MAG: ABC transporter permease [Acidimicrobiales bacterium]|nr:ABC transporter permease [Acidimicrobiales bacterium]
MALRADYVFRETASNLRRNFTLTIASLLTVAVSLSLVGAALLLRQGVQNATLRWQGGIEFIVFLNPEATPEQTEAIGRALEENPEVDEVKYVSQQEAYEEFQVLFRNSPEMVDSVSPEVLPASYRVVPRDADTTVIESVGRQFEQQPGVYSVVFAKDTVESVLKVSRVLQLGILGTAFVLLFAAGLLILNTIRMAMFARRREIEVMKLVGATNWFIRVPFMLEGLVQGLVGAAVACGSVFLLNNLIEARVSDGQSLAILQNFSVSSGEVSATAIFLVVVGVLVGTIGSGIAVSRFLDV